MADLEFELAQLVTLAIGTPEVGAVNFNLLQKVLLEMLKMTDLDTATVRFTSVEAAKLEDVLRGSIKPRSIDTGKPEEVSPAEEERTGTSLRKSQVVHQCLADPLKTDQLIDDVAKIKSDVEDLKNKLVTVTDGTGAVASPDVRSSLTQTGGLQDKVNELEKLYETVKSLGIKDDTDQPMGERLTSIEEHVMCHGEQLDTINKVLDDKLNLVLKQYVDVEKNIGIINDKLAISSSSTHLRKTSAVDKRRSGSINKHNLDNIDSRQTSVVGNDLQSNMSNVISRLASVKDELDNLSTVTSSLSAEKSERQLFMDAIVEQLDFLRMTKADKVNMEDFLAAKADQSQVYRKVSHDYFESHVKELSDQLDEAVNRLNAHEELWQDEVEFLKMDLHGKLDIMEFTPIKDYVQEKLNILQEKIKRLAAQRGKGDAAGTYRKIEDVQCISCDTDAVMRPQHTLDDVALPPALPIHHSVKPYLTYQLDQVRKQQKKLPPGRNLLHFEDVVYKSSEPKKLRKLVQNESRSGERLVNRYVGGSHTTTTPQQRLTRTGNFYQTWGPIITAMNPPQTSAA